MLLPLVMFYKWSSVNKLTRLPDHVNDDHFEECRNIDMMYDLKRTFQLNSILIKEPRSTKKAIRFNVITSSLNVFNQYFQCSD